MLIFNFTFSQNPCEIQDLDGFIYLNSFEGNNYYLSLEKDIWENANNICSTINQGHLATINSLEENNFLYNTIISFVPNNYWIGLSDVSSESNFEWVTGEFVNYTNWNFSEPNGGVNENYVEVYSINSQWPSMWNDAPGYVERYYVLEVECFETDCSSINTLPSDTVICKGDTIELNLPMGYAYSWSTGDTTSSILVSPYETTLFTVDVSNGFGNDCNTYLGDVNYDNIINVEDIVLIIDWILIGEYNSCGDVNCDQILDEQDVYIIENFILGFGDILGCFTCSDDILVIVEICGCLDSNACNYCSICTMDDGSCWYAEDCNTVFVQENNVSKKTYKNIDILGRHGAKSNFGVEFYNDGSFRKYVISRRKF